MTQSDLELHTKWERCEKVVVHVELGEMFCAREDAVGDPVHLVVLQIDRVNIGELRWATNWVGIERISGQCEG